MNDTWVSRDLPVLSALVERIDETGHHVRATKLVELTGLDAESVQRALRALDTEDPPFLGNTMKGSGSFIAVGEVTGKARRAVGAWPTPDSVTNTLLERLDQLVEDEGVSDDTRTRARKIRDALTDGGSAVLTGVLTTVLSSQLGG